MKYIIDYTNIMENILDVSIRKTERSACAVLMAWMREIIDKEKIELGYPDVDTSSTIDTKYPDIVIYESKRSQKVLCLIEAKPPYYRIHNEIDLKEIALEKAKKRHSVYFCITNFREMIWFETELFIKLGYDERAIRYYYKLSDIEDINNLDSFKYSEQIKKEIKKFLIDLYEDFNGIKKQKIPIDVYLILRIHEKVKVLSNYYRDVIENLASKDVSFLTKLAEWFKNQSWNFTWQVEDFNKVAQQTSYLLINKILFYNLLQVKRPFDLDPLEIPKDLTKGSVLQSILQIYFKQITEKIDYETIYGTDFIDEIAFTVESKEIISEIKDLIRIFSLYDFSTLGFDVIGRIFEKIIPIAERHNLGQYFTNPDIIDLINNFCVNHEDDVILDPSCGAGTFLVRTYQLKKYMNASKNHEQILNSIWGIDIAKFPAHLAMINLAINDLSSDNNYPNIVQKDFFDLKVGIEGFDNETWRQLQSKTFSSQVRDIIHPRWFDAIIGNPPYTRSEEISEISTVDNYKENIIKKALNFGNKQIAKINKNAGIFVYFFIHGFKFLKENGYFGFIVSNLWLDTEYGIGLKEFLLNNFKIITIISSKVELWFEDADIDTCIIILQKTSNKVEKDNSFIKFVSLKKPLRFFIPPAQDIWDKQAERLGSINNLKRTIIFHENFYENDEFRIYPILQKEIWLEGYDIENEIYLGSNWGKFLRAPKIYFEILNKFRARFIPLINLAKVRFGIKTGANEFFYLNKLDIQKWNIEKKFIKPIIFSLKEISGYKVDKEKLKKYIIICPKEKHKLTGTYLLKYINFGEKEGYDKRPTCASRKPWYSLAKNWEFAPIIFPAKVGERMPVFLNENIYEDKKLYGIIPKKLENTKIIAGILNSSLARLFIECNCRQLIGSQAIADIDVIKVKNLLIIDIKKIPKEKINKILLAFDQLLKTKSEGIFKEIGDDINKIDINNIKPELRNLDRIIMEEILGLSNDEQLEIYKGIVDIVKSRIEKSKNRNKTKKGQIDYDSLVKLIIDKIGENNIGKYYNKVILNINLLKKIILPKTSGKIKIEQDLFSWKVFKGKEFIECSSELEARYINIFLYSYMEDLMIPEDESILKETVLQLESIENNLNEIITPYLESIISPNERKKLNRMLLKHIYG